MSKNFSLSVFLLALFSCHGALAGTSNLEQFQEKLKKHLRQLSKKTTVSVQIEVLGSGKELFSLNPSTGLNPASNTKLLTTLAALETLGSAHTFSTRVLRNKEELVIVGGGDPYLVSEKLYLLARDVARSGIAKVSAIKVNNSAFGENYRGLTDFDQSGEPFSAVVSSASLNFNSLEVKVIPEGKKARVETGPVPHEYAILRNEVRVVGGSKKDLAVKPVKMEGDREVFAVVGTIGKDASPATVYGSVSNPEAYLAHTFAALLRKEGIPVENPYGGLIASDAGEEIAKLESAPLIDLIRLSNTFSNNFMTEQVFQALGAKAKGGPASLEKSRSTVAQFLSKNESCKNAVLDNGSGLSWATRVSAHCFLETIQQTYRDFRYFADLIGSLPIGGQTGTLKNRFRKLGSDFDPQKVRAKTGTLWSKNVVTSLVGFTRTASGEPVVFALIENDERNSTDQLLELKDWEDKCVELIQQLQL